MIDYKKTDLNNQYPKMIELPQEVKLQILIDDLNIKCCNLQRETRFNENLTVDERGELYKEYDIAIKERELAYLELYNLKEGK